MLADITLISVEMLRPIDSALQKVPSIRTEYERSFNLGTADPTNKGCPRLGTARANSMSAN
jgi:hypothetical protein